MKKSSLLRIIIFLTGICVRGTFLLHPVDTESWREADVSTIAKNFYQNGTDIFHPQINYGGSGPGYVESEFQIYSYLVAISYKIFGFWEPIGRIISFLFSLATMIVFFRLCKYMFNIKTALATSFFFSLSPILMVVSVAIQPESAMFFFYVCSGYTFIRWLDNESKTYFWLAILFTALALLCKITAANIGIFFVILIIVKKGWRFLYKPKVLVLGALSIIPSILWYSYGHSFYVLYGNSLGLSNENPWIGWDFFTSRHLITGLIKIELFNVWTKTGPFIIILALLFTKVIKKENFLFGLYWYFSAFVFYIITSRTTAENWAWYYHIFSIPGASILLGISAIELYDKFFPKIHLRGKAVINKLNLYKSRAIVFFTIIFVSFFIISCFIYLDKTKPVIYQTSQYYVCMDSLKKIIPENSLILTNGGPATDKLGYSLAIQIGYFFYWLNRRGYSISVEDLSLNNIAGFKNKGANFFVAEERFLQKKPGLEDELKKKFNTVFECNGCIVFKL